MYQSFVPGNNSVCPIPFKAHKVNEFSPEILEAHYEQIYGGAIRDLNKLERKMDQVDISTIDVKTLEYRKEQEARLNNEVLLHEVYFDSIGESGGQKLESASLTEAIYAAFSSSSVWLSALILSAMPFWIVSTRPAYCFNAFSSATIKLPALTHAVK